MLFPYGVKCNII